jgi:hypothetical protein
MIDFFGPNRVHVPLLFLASRFRHRIVYGFSEARTAKLGSPAFFSLRPPCHTAMFFFLVLAAAYMRLQLCSLRLPPFVRITFLPRSVWRPFVPVHVLLWSWSSIHRVAPGSLLVSLHYVCRLHTKQKKEHVVAGEIGIEGAIFHVFPITTRLPF